MADKTEIESKEPLITTPVVPGSESETSAASATVFTSRSSISRVTALAADTDTDANTAADLTSETAAIAAATATISLGDTSEQNAVPAGIQNAAPDTQNATQTEEQEQVQQEQDEQKEEEEDSSPLALGAPDLTPLPTYKEAGTTEVDFDGLLLRSKHDEDGEEDRRSPGPGPLLLREDLANGCGGQLWPAGMTLAKYVLRYLSTGQRKLGGKRILELGAGGGLVGLAVAKGCLMNQQQQQPPLYITDQLEMYELMKHNIELNNLGGRVEALILNWGEPLPSEVLQNPPDVILAADCVYFEPAFPLLQTTLSDLFALNEDAVVYFCFKKRRRADMQFLKQARRKFAVAEIEDDEDKHVWSRQGLFMFTFRAKGKGKR